MLPTPGLDPSKLYMPQLYTLYLLKFNTLIQQYTKY